MKIFKTAPQQGDIYSHEAPTARLLMRMTWFFIFVSAGTAAAAWNVFLTDTLAPLGGWKWLVIVAFGLFVCLPVDIMIFELSSYFWRALIKGYYKGDHRGQFITASILLLAVIVYSGVISQKGTRSAMAEGAPKEKQVNTEEADQTYKQALNLAANQFSQNEVEVDKRFAEQEKAVSRKYAVMLDGLQSEYALAEKKYSPASKRLNAISKKMQAAQTAKADELSALATAKANEMKGYQSAKLAAENTAAGVWETNIKILTDTGTGSNANKRKLSTIFSTVFSAAAGLSVLFVVLLARFIELFYHRTGITRVALVENADINGGVIADVIRFPLVWANRKLSVWVQRKYNALPDMIAPRPMDPVYDPTGMEVPIITMATDAPLPPVVTAASGQQSRMTKQPDTPPNLIPIANTEPMNRSLAGTEYASLTKSAKPIIEEQKPDADKLLSPFSLKDSKPLNDAPAKPAKGIPAEIEARIIAAFKTPVGLAGFYEVIGFSPAEYSTAFDYLEKLKKTARNSATAANNPKGTDSTRAANTKRLAYVRAELGRMSVGIMPGDAGPGSIKFSWLNEAETRLWAEKIGRGYIM